MVLAMITGNLESQSGFKGRKRKYYMRFDLFKLHDPVLDDGPRKWISGSGSHLQEALRELIKKLVKQGWSKRTLQASDGTF